jgi:hypothetical protein
MRTRAILKLEDGAELPVELERDDLENEEIVVRRTSDVRPATRDLITWVDEYLKTAERHPAGTTDRFLEADRDRPY